MTDQYNEHERKNGRIVEELPNPMIHHNIVDDSYNKLYAIIAVLIAVI